MPSTGAPPGPDTVTKSAPLLGQNAHTRHTTTKSAPSASHRREPAPKARARTEAGESGRALMLGEDDTGAEETGGASDERSGMPSAAAEEMRTVARVARSERRLGSPVSASASTLGSSTTEGSGCDSCWRVAAGAAITNWVSPG